VHFADVAQHIVGRKHRKFAVDDGNFLQLDYVLGRVKRRTVEEVEQEEVEWENKWLESSGSDDNEEGRREDPVYYDMFDGALVDLDSDS
jgi:regulatory subunit for Cdc7p protein kinase